MLPAIWRPQLIWLKLHQRAEAIEEQGFEHTVRQFVEIGSSQLREPSPTFEAIQVDTRAKLSEEVVRQRRSVA